MKPPPVDHAKIAQQLANQSGSSRQSQRRMGGARGRATKPGRLGVAAQPPAAPSAAATRANNAPSSTGPARNGVSEASIGVGEDSIGVGEASIGKASNGEASNGVGEARNGERESIIVPLKAVETAQFDGLQSAGADQPDPFRPLDSSAQDLTYMQQVLSRPAYSVEPSFNS